MSLLLWVPFIAAWLLVGLSVGVTFGRACAQGRSARERAAEDDAQARALARGRRRAA